MFEMTLYKQLNYMHPLLKGVGPVVVQGGEVALIVGITPRQLFLHCYILGRVLP